MTERITFAQFDAAMEELGFRKEVVKGSHVNYWHAGWSDPYMTRLHKSNDIVPGYVLDGTRFQLESLGIIAGAEFDQLLHSAAA